MKGSVNIMTIEQMKNIKEERGYSMSQLSEYSGVPLGTLQKIFSGETKNPRKSTIAAIEKVLFGEESVYQGKAYTYHMESKGISADHIREYIQKNQGDCIPVFAPSDVQLDCDNKTMVQPDVMIICAPKKIHHFGVFGAPDFVLEVLSPSTRKKDLTIKLSKYINAGVREYWIIDPEKKILITYDFAEEGMPCIYPLKGEVGLAIYEEKLKINLTKIAEIIEKDYKD